MIVTWKCTNDNCQESNHFEVRNKLTIVVGEPDKFCDEVFCWQCGKKYYLQTEMSATLEEE